MHEPSPTDVRGVDTEKIDAGRRVWRGVAICLLLGLVLGGLIGAAYGRSRPVSYQASTALSVLPDSVVEADQQATAPTLDATSYIQGQLITVNGAQLSDEVRSQLKLSSAPDVTATQVGQTYVVQITANAASKRSALAVATATGSLYRTLRIQQLTKEIDASINSTNARLKTIQATLGKTKSTAGSGGALTPAQTALQTEYERLLSNGSSLTLARTQVDSIVTVQSPARIVAPSISTAVKDAIGGAVLGALLAVVIALFYRRAVPRIRTIGDVSDLGVAVLLPVLTRRSWRNRRASAVPSKPARLLAARLAGRERSRPLVVVGATSKVGTSFTATSLATALAARGPVLLILGSSTTPEAAARAKAEPTTDSAPTTHRASAGNATRRVEPSTVPGVWILPDGSDLIGAVGGHYAARIAALVDVVNRASTAGWLVVVDAGSLSESDVALDCLRAHDAVGVLVVRRGVSRPADVVGAAELFEVRGANFAGAIVNDVPGRVGRALAGQQGVTIVRRPAGERRSRDAAPGEQAPTGGSVHRRSKGQPPRDFDADSSYGTNESHGSSELDELFSAEPLHSPPARRS